MVGLKKLGFSLLASVMYAQNGAAQDAEMFTHEETGITFATWTASLTSGGDFVTGIALPGDALTADATEYIGYLRCNKNAGWCGVSHGASGQMTQALLLMTWPYEDQVMTSFRFATGYAMPDVYTGDAKLTQIYSSAEGDEWEILYRCENCYSWSQDGASGEVSTSGGFLVMGRAASADIPENAGCPSGITFGYHDQGFGQWGAALEAAVSDKYSEWAALATMEVADTCETDNTPETSTVPTDDLTPPEVTESAVEPTGTENVTDAPSATATGTSTKSKSKTNTKTKTKCGKPPKSTTTTATSEPTPTTTPLSCAPAPTGQAYDYIVIGGGAGGIPVADRLSEAGHSVLLIEKGDVSTGRWGGDLGPEWLEGTNLTRFDVPGLCNQIWHDSVGIACTDTDQMAGCLLGGGTAVNAGLWWKPNPKDWDENFPEGWKSEDLEAATDRMFERIPGTTTPSMDGQLYRQEGFNILTKGLEEAGYESVIPNEDFTRKNRTYGHTTYMFSDGERGGPLATYLVTAAERDNFDLWVKTSVSRILRTGGKATGVSMTCYKDGGYEGDAMLSENGRIIVAAGTFGSAKLLIRSGIGPEDQLQVVKESVDAEFMVAEEDWIDLPVGYGLVDHVNTDLVVAHPGVVFYDFYEAWEAPNKTDKEMYLDERSGILAQAAPNIGPMIWEEVTTSDGKVRQLQWTARVEGGELQEDAANTTMFLSQYLGRGSTSRGRMTLTTKLDSIVSEVPFFNDEHDLEAVIMGIENLQAALSNVPNLTWIWPEGNLTAAEYVATIPVGASNRRSNHWMGTNKMSSLGLENDGESVVDANAKVFGTDNIFVMDASIFPGQPTGNPSAMIVIAAENVAERLLALDVAEAEERLKKLRKH